MASAPVIEREGNPRIHQQVIGGYLRRVGPRGSEFDYACLILKLWRLYFIVNRYAYGLRVHLQWWPKSKPIRPAVTFLHVMHRFSR